jgi:hydroxymethylglutaryl-CoA lyase
LNRRGAERAVIAGLRHLQFVLSVSEKHNRENAGRSVADSLVELQTITALAADGGAVVEVTLATAFGCPFDGPVVPARVEQVAEQVRGLGVAGLSVADTIGAAAPNEVTVLVEQLRVQLAPIEIGVHLHDTRGLAMANALAGIAAGAVRVDGALGGLGGCPFAPGASGNLPLEDLVHALDAMGVTTGIDLQRLLEASFLACELVGRTPTSHLSQAGPRFAREAVPREG